MAVRTNPAGINEILTKRGPLMTAALARAAETVAANARAQGIKVGDVNGGPDEVDLPVISGVSDDELAGIVTLAHPAGMAVQLKHGTLTKAAAQAGLKVRGAR